MLFSSVCKQNQSPDPFSPYLWSLLEDWQFSSSLIPEAPPMQNTKKDFRCGDAFELATTHPEGVQMDGTIQQNWESFDTCHQKHCHTCEFVIDVIHHDPFCWKLWWFDSLCQELPFTLVMWVTYTRSESSLSPERLTYIGKQPSISLCSCLGITGISPTAYISFDLGATDNCCSFCIHAGFHVNANGTCTSTIFISSPYVTCSCIKLVLSGCQI